MEGIFNKRGARLENCLTPRWWTAPFGYLSFIPLHPSFTGYPLDRLAHIPPLEMADGGQFQLNRALAEGWYRLEQRLARAISLLLPDYRVGVILPFHPSTWGYGYPHFSHYIARQRAVISKDWFVIFLAGLSFLLAIGDTLTLDDGIPDWFAKLANAGYDQAWLAGIGGSQLRHFSPTCPRVGIIVDFVNPEKTQPAVKWFANFHIPIWYPWTNAEQDWVSAHRGFDSLIPPPHKLQAATTFMTRQPTPVSDSLDTPAPPPVLVALDSWSAPASTAKTTCPTWVEFFEKRERLNAQKLGKETEKERQTRLNRARKPPTHTAPVFEWVKSDDDPTQLVRRPVLKAEREDTLDNYSASQRRYDPFWNEWDCCEEFGPGDQEYDDDEGFPVHPQIDADRTHDPPIRSDIRSPSPPPIVEHQPDWEGTPDASEVLHVLFMYYGFIPPLTISDQTEQVEPDARTTFFRITGLPTVTESVFATGLGKVVNDFILNLSDKKKPDESLWDLRKGNRDALAFKSRTSQIHRLPCGILFFDFGQKATVPWKIAVSQPAIALYICRLDRRYDEVDIARDLLQEGIPFHTLLPLRGVPRSVLPHDPTVPIRLSGYRFTTRDYNAYLHQRAAILSGPGGRAALLQGGILWRLAVQETSFDSVIQGPSSSVLIHRSGIAYEDPQSGNRFWDDGLSENQVLLLCGAYICYTGRLYFIP